MNENFICSGVSLNKPFLQIHSLQEQRIHLGNRYGHPNQHTFIIHLSLTTLACLGAQKWQSCPQNVCGLREEGKRHILKSRPQSLSCHMLLPPCRLLYIRPPKTTCPLPPDPSASRPSAAPPSLQWGP